MELDVLAIGAHPDDVELGCGATLALLARQGHRVGILHLTRGEMGTRGTDFQRRQEAERAAQLLGASELSFLDCGDGGFRNSESEEDRLITILRDWRPRLVFGPSPTDRHPDHGRAHSLVRQSCYYAGLAKRGSGKAHRPAALFSYMQHDPFTPSFIVDVTAAWEAKIAALAAYRSQLYQPDNEDLGPDTKVSSPEFLSAIEGRARHFGVLIGAAFGEPFWSRLPLAVADPLSILPKGIP